MTWEMYKYKGKKLWEEFREDFEGWKIEWIMKGSMCDDDSWNHMTARGTRDLESSGMEQGSDSTHHLVGVVSQGLRTCI